MFGKNRACLTFALPFDGRVGFWRAMGCLWAAGRQAGASGGQVAGAVPRPQRSLKRLGKVQNGAQKDKVAAAGRGSGLGPRGPTDTKNAPPSVAGLEHITMESLILAQDER